MLALLDLPEELIQSCIRLVLSRDLLNFAKASKKCYELAIDPYLWRAHCLHDFAHWSSRHHIEHKRKAPVGETNWRGLFQERMKIDKAVLRALNSLIENDLNRIEKTNEIAMFEDDAKDTLLRNLWTPDDSDDVLARRYYSRAVLSHLNRLSACRAWMLWRKRELLGEDAAPETSLERALVAFDVFVSPNAGDEFELLDQILDDAVTQIREAVEDWDSLSLREKSAKVAEYLYTVARDPIRPPFEALKGCLIYESSKQALGAASNAYIVSAIYCALARRLGFKAHALFPTWFQVYNIVQDPHRVSGETISRAEETIWLDPYNVPYSFTKDEFQNYIQETGGLFSADSPALRAPYRPIKLLQSIATEMRGKARDMPEGSDRDYYTAAHYASRWSAVILNGRWTDDLEDDDPMSHAQDILGCLKTTPEDWRLVMEFIMPLFSRSPHLDDFAGMLKEVKDADNDSRPVKHRTESTKAVKHLVGQMVRHRRYGWEGVITGWDHKCAEGDMYCQTYGVYGLPNGRNQPFYQVLTEVDGVTRSSRYVAQDNVEVVQGPPSAELLQLAGQKFKRWDGSSGMFVSNIKHQYPDD